MDKLNIHMIVIAYGLAEDTKNLLAVESVRHALHWHLFLHSQYDDVVEVCRTAATRDDVTLYNYGVNRGLSRSWNEGILAAYGDGADVVILSNDDILPEPDAIDVIAEHAVANPKLGIVQGTMYDRRSDKQRDTGFGFTAVNQFAVEIIGMFDEQLFPVYFEDMDYAYRLMISGIHTATVDTEIVHEGSKNIHEVPGLFEQNQVTFAANRAYYIRKWGGPPGEERFRQPFNDIRFCTRIAPCDKGRPYPGYDRDDYHLVEI